MMGQRSPRDSANLPALPAGVSRLRTPVVSLLSGPAPANHGKRLARRRRGVRDLVEGCAGTRGRAEPSTDPVSFT